MDVLDEYENRTNDDETVTLEVSFTLDPKVVAEKAKAMAKGIKRDDLTDDLGVDTDTDGDDVEEVYADDVGDNAILVKKPKFEENEGEGSRPEVEEDEDPFNGVSTEDESPDAVSMDELDDEIVDTEDARQNSRHSQTPLDNCRAKDPRFCPYHGDKAWQKKVEDDLVGVPGAKVDVKNENGRYKVQITVPAGMSSAAESAIDGIVNTNGVITESRSNSGTVVSAAFKTDFGMLDRPGRLNEWVDDYMTDVAGDPSAEIDMDDFNALLEAQEDIETFELTMDTNNANDVLKYNGMVEDAEKKYHVLMAQQYMKDVKDDKQAQEKSDEINKSFNDSYDAAHAEKDATDAAKAAIFGTNVAGKVKTPRGFGASHGWWDALAKKNTNLFFRATDEYIKSTDEFAKAKDLKAKRAALSSMDYRKDNFIQGAAAYKTMSQEFMRSFYDWAVNDPNYQGKVSAAFPNGRP